MNSGDNHSTEVIDFRRLEELTAMNTEELIEENNRLRDKIKKLEAALKR